MAAIKLSKISGFHTACASGDLDTVMLYLRNEKSEFVSGKRVMVFHLDPSGSSGLALASTGGHRMVAEALLNVPVPPKSQAGINGQSTSGQTALMAAAEAGHRDMVGILLARGADVALTNKMGDTALHYAARNLDVHSRTEIMSMIAAGGVDPAVKNQQGLTAEEVMRTAASTKEAAAIAATEQAPKAEAQETTQVEDKKDGTRVVVESFVDPDGKRIKKIMDLSQATWDANGRRVVPEVLERDGKETNAEKKARKREEKKRQEMEQQEQAYIEETGDKQGFKGFVKVGDRELTVEEQLCRDLEGMGFEAEGAQRAAREAARTGATTAAAVMDTAVQLAEEAVEALKVERAAEAAAREAAAKAKEEQARARAAQAQQHPPPPPLPLPHMNAAAPVFVPGAPPPSMPPPPFGPPMPHPHVLHGPPMPFPPVPPPHFTPAGHPAAAPPYYAAPPAPLQPPAGGPAPQILSPATGAAAGRTLMQFFAEQKAATEREEKEGGEEEEEEEELDDDMVDEGDDDEEAPAWAEDGAPGTSKKGFATDTEISNTNLKERELKAFEFELQETDGTNEHFTPQKRKEGMGLDSANMELGDGKAGWDQFKANEAIYGARTTYNEEFYTTKLDKGNLTKEQRARAAALAAEIERETGRDEEDAGGEDDAWASDVHRTK